MRDFNEFEGTVPYNGGRYFLLNNGNVLEVIRELEAENPCVDDICAGDYGTGTTLEEAYANAWENMGSDTTDIIEERVDKFLDTTEVEVKAEMSPKAMFDICKAHDVDLSDIVIVKELTTDRNSAAVVFVEAYDFKAHTDCELKNVSQEVKDDILDEAIEMLQNWNAGDVYQLTIYDKNGDFASSMCGFYGDEAMQDALDFIGDVFGDEKLCVSKEIGTYADIANCLYANRKELAQIRGDER